MLPHAWQTQIDCRLRDLMCDRHCVLFVPNRHCVLLVPDRLGVACTMQTLCLFVPYRLCVLFVLDLGWVALARLPT